VLTENCAVLRGSELASIQDEHQWSV